jgi:hypothetical protein
MRSADACDELQEAQNLVDAYDLLVDSHTSRTLADAQALQKASAKVLIPKDYTHAHMKLQALVVLFWTLIGEAHPLVLSLHQAVQQFAGNEAYYQQGFNTLKVWGPASFLHSIQVSLGNWFRKMSRSSTLLAVPTFLSALDKIDDRDYDYLPKLPERYTRVVEPRAESRQAADSNRSPAQAAGRNAAPAARARASILLLSTPPLTLPLRRSRPRRRVKLLKPQPRQARLFLRLESATPKRKCACLTMSVAHVGTVASVVTIIWPTRQRMLRPF